MRLLKVHDMTNDTLWKYPRMLVHIAISKCLHSLVSWAIHIFSACLLHAKKRQEEENTYDPLNYCVHAHTDARQLASPGSHRSSVTGSGNAQEKEVTLHTHVNSIYVCISTCTLYVLHVCACICIVIHTATQCIGGVGSSHGCRQRSVW